MEMGKLILSLTKFRYSRYFVLFLRIIVGSVFIYASLDKIAYPLDFVKIVNNYGILPDPFVKIVGFVLPWLELLLGILLITGIMNRVSAFGISLLLITFMGAIIIKSLNGTLENCGCFSTSDNGAAPSVFLLLLRNILLLISSIYLIIVSNSLKQNNNNV